jgi:hypothetical protein
LFDLDDRLAAERESLASEAGELMNIFGAIVRKCEDWAFQHSNFGIRISDLFNWLSEFVIGV